MRSSAPRAPLARQKQDSCPPAVKPPKFATSASRPARVAYLHRNRNQGQATGRDLLSSRDGANTMRLQLGQSASTRASKPEWPAATSPGSRPACGAGSGARPTTLRRRRSSAAR
jgi:hypothetical protein